MRPRLAVRPWRLLLTRAPRRPTLRPAPRLPTLSVTPGSSFLRRLEAPGHLARLAGQAIAVSVKLEVVRADDAHEPCVGRAVAFPIGGA